MPGCHTPFPLFVSRFPGKPGPLRRTEAGLVGNTAGLCGQVGSVRVQGPTEPLQMESVTEEHGLGAEQSGYAEQHSRHDEEQGKVKTRGVSRRRAPMRTLQGPRAVREP